MSLVLTLQEGTFVNIDGPATITLVSVRGNQVRIGFDAPKSTVIKRSTLKTESITRKFIKESAT